MSQREDSHYYAIRILMKHAKPNITLPLENQSMRVIYLVQIVVSY